jgi:hypothetical protein
MSFEGYYRLLCEDGHLEYCDVYQDPPAVCDARIDGHKCNKPFVWENTVDETNGVDKEFGVCPGAFPLEVESEQVVSACKHCNETKLISHKRYKIPTDKGSKHNPNEEWG